MPTPRQSFASDQAKQMMGAGNPLAGKDLRAGASIQCPKCSRFHRAGNVCPATKSILDTLFKGSASADSENETPSQLTLPQELDKNQEPEPVEEPKQQPQAATQLQASDLMGMLDDGVDAEAFIDGLAPEEQAQLKTQLDAAKQAYTGMQEASPDAVMPEFGSSKMTQMISSSRVPQPVEPAQPVSEVSSPPMKPAQNLAGQETQGLLNQEPSVSSPPTPEENQQKVVDASEHFRQQQQEQERRLREWQQQLTTPEPQLYIPPNL